MAAIFCDASGIAKRYINEIGTSWVNGIVDPATSNWTYLARITGVEVVSAISRRQSQGSISSIDAAKMLAQFRDEFANIFHILEITLALWTRR